MTVPIQMQFCEIPPKPTARKAPGTAAAVEEAVAAAVEEAAVAAEVIAFSKMEKNSFHCQIRGFKVQ